MMCFFAHLIADSCLHSRTTGKKMKSLRTELGTHLRSLKKAKPSG